MKLFIRRNDKDYGPYPIEQIKQFLKEGRLLKNDQASEDRNNWKELLEFLKPKKEDEPELPPPVEDLVSQVVDYENLEQKDTENSLSPSSPKISSIGNQPKFKATNSGRKSKGYVVIITVITCLALLVIGVILYLFLKDTGSQKLEGDSAYNQSDNIQNIEANSSNQIDNPVVTKQVVFVFEDQSPYKHESGKGWEFIEDFKFTITFMSDGSNTFELQESMSSLKSGAWYGLPLETYEFVNKYGESILSFPRDDLFKEDYLIIDRKINKIDQQRFHIGENLPIKLNELKEVKKVVPTFLRR